MKNLTDKVIVITGAGSGIGRALAVQLAGQGATLALNDYNAETLAETVSQLDGKVSQHVFDVSDKEAFYAFAKDVIQLYGQVDVVINNAGVALGEITVSEVSLEQMEWLMGINYWGVVYGTKAFLPHLLERPEASLVNISSVFGIIGVGTQATYCAAKFAVRGFTEALRMEMRIAGSKLCVTSVHPGGIKTNIARSARDEHNPDRKARSAKSFDKLTRTSAEDAAKTIIRGIKKKKHRVLIGGDARLIDFIARFLPVRYTGLFVWGRNRVEGKA